MRRYNFFKSDAYIFFLGFILLTSDLNELLGLILMMFVIFNQIMKLVVYEQNPRL